MNETPIKIGLVGFGYWGPNLARNFHSSEDFDLAAICDTDVNTHSRLSSSHPKTQIVASFEELLNVPGLSAVAIATPASTHFAFAKRALQAGKHVLVEKPLTTASSEAFELVELAKAFDLQLMVDHTFVYSPAVQFLQLYASDDRLGRFHSFDSTRINLGLLQYDSNVLWDLAVHDVSILNSITSERPDSVSATGSKIKKSFQESTAFMTLFYESGFIAHINVSWFSPVKIRRTIITGEKKMILYDDLETNEKIKIYDSGVKFTDGPDDRRQQLVSYRTGDILSPWIANTEALRNVVESFAKSIRSHKPPATDGRFGLEVVSVIEAATNSMHRYGAQERIDFQL